MKRTNFFFIFLIFFYANNIFAADQIINLIVAYKTVYFAGKPRKAIAVNDQIPAPMLHFKEGDHVVINVYNALDQETAIHWHGMLVPWQMDGVLGVSQQGIQPGQFFRYEFTLHQAGTYWYHAHAGLQEQQGLYGAFLIDPAKKPTYQYTKDYVVVLSDWSNTQPNQILANLKKDGDYYSPKFPLQPSLAKFIHDYANANLEERKKIVDDYKTMQHSRMNLYDLSDVAFDAFLLNGFSNDHPWRAVVNVGDTVRLRFIGAAGNTIFHVKIPETVMQVVHVEGNDVVPYAINDFTIAPGETYDVLIKIQQNKPYIIYAESADTLGAAYGALITNPQQFVDFKAVLAFPEPLPVTREMMHNMMMSEMNHRSISNYLTHPSSKKSAEQNRIASHAIHQSSQMKLNHAQPVKHSMHMSAEPSIIGDAITAPLTFNEKTTPGTKYQQLKASVKTNDPNKPIKGIIRMELSGYMDRFIWFINGLPEYKAKPIVLEPGQRYRIIFTNASMMHHPMHMHGHWFILRKGLGSYDPLLHTLDVAPGTKMIVDVDTDASGQWFFHCHLIYHMIAGMARVFQYSTLLEITKDEMRPEHIIKNTAYLNRPIVRVDQKRPIDIHLVQHPSAHPVGLYFANFLDVGIDPIHNVQELTFKGMYGFDYDKLELMIKDAEINKGKTEDADLDIFYWRLISQFWAIKGGINYFYRPALKPYWQPGIGVEGLLPYFIDMDLRSYYYHGSEKLDAEFSRDTQLTNNLFLRLGIRAILATKTVTSAQIGSGLNQTRYTVRPYYRIIPGLNVFAEYEYQKNYGSFKTLQNADGESSTENTLTFGLSVIF